MAVFGTGCLLVIITLVVGIGLRAFVLACTWGWFIVPVLHIQQISPVQAVGFSIFASIIFGATWRPQSDHRQSAWEWIWGAIGPTVVAPLVIFGIAWGWHLVMLSDQSTWPWWLQRLNQGTP